MKYTRFEELPVWNDAIDLAVRGFTLTALLLSGITEIFAIKLSAPRCQSQTISLKVLKGELHKKL